MTENNIWNGKCGLCSEFMEFIDDRFIEGEQYEYFECNRCSTFAIARRCLVIENAGKINPNIEDGKYAFDTFELNKIKDGKKTKTKNKNKK